MNQLDKIDQKVQTKVSGLTERIKALEENIVNIKNELSALKDFTKEKFILNTNQIQEQIKTQEDIIMSMIHKFDDQFLQEKTKILSEIEEIKSQYDVLKISFTVNEKNLLEKIKAMIESEIRLTVKGKEKEILMKLWIEELKEIINDFEKLKKAKPKEFMLQLNEITSIIDSFKRKIL
ncbi:MAG: hypothetical protein ACTSQJ_03300 [Promethearchaeota archaeon]